MSIQAPDPRVQTEVTLLATTVGVEVDTLVDLLEYDADTLHDLRKAVSAHLFDGQSAVFARVSRLAPLVPNSVVAKVVPGVVPPLVAGRAAGALGIDHPGRIEDLLSRLPAEYLADCAPHLDPRVIAVLAPTVAPRVLIPAARILLERREYLTAANFVEHATPELAAEFERNLDDDLGLLATASLIYSDEALGGVIATFPIERLRRILDAAQQDEEYRKTATSVLDRLPQELRERLQSEIDLKQMS